ncbi:hypothetical protein [Dietzia sp. PP-33]|jgi:hypothetical protein|uniref:hypothetical protein n=1 Tax=Dietzia sp. PP-33 TaxID=2957500 RepID=UPI0029BCE894|nr:hypothetical protein [Dietzia sp. PP-33]MDX2357449.1 hypothetical protein [Dietzia sp. PP-33]
MSESEATEKEWPFEGPTETMQGEATVVVGSLTVRINPDGSAVLVTQTGEPGASGPETIRADAFLSPEQVRDLGGFLYFNPK